MELNISHLESIDTTEFSDSVFNSGRNDIGQVTWRNACRTAEETPLVSTPEDVDTVVDWLEGFGAWEREELDAMSTTEVNGLLLQFIAGDLAEFLENEDDADWQERCGGRVSRADDGQLFFYVGN